MTPLEALQTLDLRLGQITRAQPNPKAKKPAYQLWIDFGPLGIKTSSAQLTDLYTPDQLVGRHIIAAINLGVRNIAGFPSEVLIVGLPTESNQVVLLTPDPTRPAPPLGSRVF